MCGVLWYCVMGDPRYYYNQQITNGKNPKQGFIINMARGRGRLFPKYGSGGFALIGLLRASMMEDGGVLLAGLNLRLGFDKIGVAAC